ncbi:putative DNA-directed RNA polymerase [Ordospora colligata]|uniref:DNA-directed RNA polymerase subunit n=1 Tax=Ordospora colligata OC4 TaxID=1354746 RepID=A0A0B2UIU8_9MICR|nr:putative DNA-directed RNA polymerase [Ordospora colligata OC4]KHN68905.1 putative DNA-directed RNA polymerase [Ordospora colligata OC4]TBU13939.1 putative DNA-directed RNA polymerase [Ordospora colligata]TBU14128.1 putative DNA-directed RNA polymerase [Ordospora colligata]TBU17797.1 putative DNA-directed RNA polymerase [Ordospora colligata]
MEIIPSDRFCRECNNLLYPKEDSQENTLLMACKNCEHIQETKSHCLYSKSFRTKHKAMEVYAKDLLQDPTLPQVKIDCAKCGFNKGIYFQSRDDEDDVALSIFYLCCKCNHLWT